MKCLIYSDVHWNTNSSLIRSVGKKYSVRLEYLIKSMNWVNQTAIDKDCDIIFCLGDFFDRSNCTDTEITAIRDLIWDSDVPSYFLCGNHESSVADLRYNMLKVLESTNRTIIDTPTVKCLPTCDILFLPYVTEADRKSLRKYKEDLKDQLTGKPLIILSHNELAGINYGGFESKTGFPLPDISAECKLFLNGHLHNSGWVSANALNVGSFSAHNFTNDSFNFSYGIWILDTDTLKLEFIENPYGFNFYKLDVNSESDLKKLSKIKQNSVLSIKCVESLTELVTLRLEELGDKILESRITRVKPAGDVCEDEISIADLQTDHLAKFVEFCKNTMSNSELLCDELQKICT